jgi:hypothetical protein
MKRSLIAAAMAIAVAPLAGAAQTSGTHEITIHGCVIPGEDKGTYAMTRVEETPGLDGTRMPDWAHGRRVLFWLRNDDNVRHHIGRMVEVRGTMTGLKESEIELKAGRQKNGELVVEFEGPGKDVTVPNSAVGNAIGTAGRTVPEKNDIKSYLAYIDVKQVRVISGDCK